MTQHMLESIAVKMQFAEQVRKHLIKEELLRKNYKITRDKEYVYFPVITTNLPASMEEYAIVKKSFEEKELSIRSYKELVSLPEELKRELPTSYDVIGKILLIKLPPSLLKYKKEIGDALLQANASIRTVCITEPVTGELRTRAIEVIAGKKKTNTIHREYGLEFCVDVQKTYFSSRLASERKRVASLVQPGETIVDMFAGVAPFSIMIARFADPKLIYAVDKNKYAIKCAQKNVSTNNFLDKIEIIHADAKNISVILGKKGVKANRIIMNLPFSSYKFFKIALEIIDKTCTIHYYDVLYEDEINKRTTELKKIAAKKRISLVSFKINKIKTYAPREFYIGMDITATTLPM